MSAPIQDWRVLLLNALGAPSTEANLQFLSNWNQQEGNLTNQSGLGINNPLNTTLDFGGGTSVNSVGVKLYPDLSTGVQATAQTLKAGASTYSYQNIIDALKSGDPFTYSGDLATPLQHWSGNGYSSILGRTSSTTTTTTSAPASPTAGSSTTATANCQAPSGTFALVNLPGWISYWLCVLIQDVQRAAFIVGGAAVILVGLWLLTKEEDVPGHDLHITVAQGAKTAGKAAGTAAVAAA